MDLARQPLSLLRSSKLEKDIADLRWCISQILSVILKLGDAGILNLGVGPEEGFKCLLRLVDVLKEITITSVNS